MQARLLETQFPIFLFSPTSDYVPYSQPNLLVNIPLSDTKNIQT